MLGMHDQKLTIDTGERPAWVNDVFRAHAEAVEHGSKVTIVTPRAEHGVAELAKRYKSSVKLVETDKSMANRLHHLIARRSSDMSRKE